jgi:ribosome-binding factor A
MSKRTEKIESVLARLVADSIRTLFDPQESGIFTVQKVIVFPDLSEAKIFVSHYGGEKKFFDRLNGASHRIQKMVNKGLVMKKTPVLHFFEDKTGEVLERMEHLTKKD